MDPMDEAYQLAIAHGYDVKKEARIINRTRFLSWLRPAPVVQGWPDAACDGAIYCGNLVLAADYAGRYVNIDKNDASFIPFATASMQSMTMANAQSRLIARFEMEIPEDQQRHAQFFLIICSRDPYHALIVPKVLLAFNQGTKWVHEELWQMGVLVTSPPGLSRWRVRMDQLALAINRIRLYVVNRHYSGDVAEQDACMPHWEDVLTVPDSILASPNSPEAAGLTFLYQALVRSGLDISIDFLHYVPIVQGWKLQIQSRATCTIQHKFDKFIEEEETLKHENCFLDPAMVTRPVSHLKYSEFLLTQTTNQQPNIAYFIPSQIIPQSWMGGSQTLKVPLATVRAFRMELDDEDRWTRRFYDIVCEYLLGQSNRRRGDSWREDLHHGIREEVTIQTGALWRTQVEGEDRSGDWKVGRAWSV
ncbi:MAG: hypothetical protein Q9183_004162 [Haloplaca sp. 2 TL-2023]